MALTTQERIKGLRVDTALLGELIVHKDFMKLPAGINVYVNGLAAMQVHNLNTWVEALRAKHLNEYQQGELDMDVLLSDAILLRERDYFISRVHEDIDAVMEDIRETHWGRSESGPEHSAIAEFKQDLEDVANFSCAFTGHRPKKLPFFSRVVCSGPAFIFPKLHVEYPMKLVFNPPVAAFGIQYLAGCHLSQPPNRILLKRL